MTLRHFKIFVAVCDTMNMTAAAQSLFISQSAISQAIAELEKYYSVRLFERLSCKLYLTQAGEKLLGYARHMTRMNEDIEKDMKALHSRGVVRVGASVTVGANVLPKLISAFKRQNPHATVEVFEDNTTQIEKRLLRDETDIGLVEGDITSKDLKSISFADDELVLICSKKHRFANLSMISPAELETEDFIIREQGSGTRKTFEDVMTANRLAWNISWTCNNADTIKLAVAEGLGVSVISKRAVVNEVNAGALIIKKVDGIHFYRNFKIVYHKNKYLTAVMQELIDLCLEKPKA